MKHKLFTMLLMVTAVCFGIASCSSDDETESVDKSLTRVYFVGYWNHNSKEVFDFKSDGTLEHYTLSSDNSSTYSEKRSGTWFFNDKELSYTIQGLYTKNITILKYDMNVFNDSQTVWNRVFSLPRAEDEEENEDEGGKTHIDISDIRGHCWRRGGYIFEFGYNDKLTVYHELVNKQNYYDYEMKGTWSFDSKTNEISIKWKDETSTMESDIWKVVLVTDEYLELDITKLPYTPYPHLDTEKALEDTWSGTFDYGDVDLELTFSSNHRFTMKESFDGEACTSKGTWSLDGHYITFEYSEDESVFANTYGYRVLLYDINPDKHDGQITLAGNNERIYLNRKK